MLEETDGLMPARSQDLVRLGDGTVSYRAAYWRRMLAVVIDIVFFLLAWMAFNVLLFVIMVIAFMSINEAANSLSAGGGSLSLLQLIAFMAFVPISLLYAGYSIVDRGQTPGKRILKLQILDAKTGRFPNAIAVIFRYGLLFIPYFNVLVALSPLWNSDGRGWHDRFGRTVVIQYQKPDNYQI